MYKILYIYIYNILYCQLENNISMYSIILLSVVLMYTNPQRNLDTI